MSFRRMKQQGPNPYESFEDNPREAKIGELLNEYFDRRQSGEQISEEAFLSEHAEFADELRAHLGGLDLIRGLGSSDGDATREASPRRGVGSSGDEQLARAPVEVPEIPGYQVLKQIGRGGMGVVFKAIQLSTKRVVALKLLLEGPFASENARRRFEREIALAAQLRHPNIIPIYDSGEAKGRMYYAMEHVFGLPLNDYLRAHQFDLRRKLGLFVKVCEPVSHAHMRGVIHRDLKPSNILVDGNEDPHILDFGLAKAGSIVDNTTSISAQIVGTPAYMSPEQASGDPTGVDTRVDIYALGIILYEMLTGAMPYDTNVAMGKVLHNIAHAEPAPPHKVNSRIDADLSTVVLKALEKRKEDRYQSVDALSGDVKRFLAGEPITAKPASSFYLIKKAVWKHKLPTAIAAAAVLFAATTFLIINHFSRKLEIKATQLEQRSIEVSQSREELERKQAEVEELARQERQKQDVARVQYDSIKRNLPPDAQKSLDSLVGAIAAGSGRPEEIGLRILAEAVSQQVLAETEAPPIKKGPVDSSSMLFSPRPEWAPPGEKSGMSREEILSEIGKLAGALMNAQPESTTTQPATTQPAASQPAPVAPSETAAAETAKGEAASAEKTNGDPKAETDTEQSPS